MLLRYFYVFPAIQQILMNKSKKILFLLLALISVLLNFQPIHAERPPFTIYTTEDGLAHDSVNKVVRDSRGFLWFCTAEGLSRFDGTRFSNYTQDQGLPHRNINDFLETNDGTYLIATSFGLTVFNPNGKIYRWNVLESKLEQTSDEPPMFQTFVPETDNRQKKIILSLAQDKTGQIWAGTAFGLFQIEKIGDKWQFREIDVEPGVTVGFGVLLPDSKGNLLIGSDAGLYKISPDGKIEKFDKFGAASMMEDRTGNIWVGAGGNEIGIRIFSYQNQELKLIGNYTEKDGLLGNSFQFAMKQTSDGEIYIGLHKGLCLFLPLAKGPEPKFRALEYDKITSITEDEGGNLWFATEVKGAWKLARRGFTNFGEKDGILPTDDLRSIFVSKKGEIFIPTRPSRILHLVNGKFEGIVPYGFKARSWGWHFLDFESKDGEWWVAGTDGLRHYPKVAKFSDLARTPPLKIFTKTDGLYINEVFNIFEDSGGNIWIITSDHISRLDYHSEKLATYNDQNGLPRGNGVISFAEDRDGNIWFGFFFGGLARFKNGKFDFFASKDGLPESQVSDLLIDKTGRLWIGTSGFGLFRLDSPDLEKPEFKSISTQNGLSSNQIICMTEDSFGRTYIGTGRGINRIDKNGTVKIFTQADGLPSNFITRCAADNNGFLWFTAGNTLVRLTPEITQVYAPSSVFIDKISVNGVPQKISALGESEIELPELSAGERQIQIDFFALTFGSGDNIRYQYQLDGQEWSSPTDQQTINLDLSAGKHYFAVRALRTDGISSEKPAIVSVKISAPIWQRWWFILLSAFMVTSIILFLYRYRTANLRKINTALTEAKRAEEDLRKSREERLAELEKVRSRIATDLHDDIGASLTQIAILSEVARAQGKNGKPSAFAEPLTKISDVTNELVDAMSDIVWSINPAKDHLSDLTQRMRRFASDVLSAKGIAFHFLVTDADKEITVNANLRREVFLLFKEAINNIVKHSEAKQVEIELKISGGNLTLNISDDGKGFAFDPDSTNGSDNYGGNGILNLKKRAAEMNGSVKIVSQPGSGTNVNLMLPIENFLPV
jgi:signal transduction histidine kinase/ligand-binding sensor domain-containing protein